ncbi:hypothetical protein IAD21_04221 [Abditibacteriota bacterium]|nr:hypothetical protein IAD21_04221 [Abditibacteriota bacterium]
MRAPRRIAINPDSDQARFVGTTHDGRQFFAVTCLTDDGSPRQHAEFRALYLFDARETLLEARIEEVTTRSGNVGEAIAALEAMVAELGGVTIERIMVKPFAVERFGLEFGLVVQRPTRQERAAGEDWLWVSLQPGDSMAFQAPFDSGEYDT